MAIKLDNKEVVTFEELLMSQVVQQEALTSLLVDKGIFTKEEFWAMAKELSEGEENELIAIALEAWESEQE